MIQDYYYHKSGITLLLPKWYTVNAEPVELSLSVFQKLLKFPQSVFFVLFTSHLHVFTKQFQSILNQFVLFFYQQVKTNEQMIPLCCPLHSFVGVMAVVLVWHCFSHRKYSTCLLCLICSSLLQVMPAIQIFLFKSAWNGDKKQILTFMSCFFALLPKCDSNVEMEA